MLEPQCSKPSSKVSLESVDSFWLPSPCLNFGMCLPKEEPITKRSWLLQVSFFRQTHKLSENKLRVNPHGKGA